MVDLLTESFDVVVRFQGGGNAGHTVINKYGEFMLHLLPSGVFRPNVVNVLGNGVALDPEHLINEVHTLREKGVEITPVEEDYQESSLYGKRFASTGGVANAVIEAMKEMGEDTSGISLLRCAGGDECKKALMMLKAGRLKEDFIEGMICPGGCVGGPSKHQVENLVEKARIGLLSKADKRGILENLEKYPMDKFSMYRDGHLEE